MVVDEAQVIKNHNSETAQRAAPAARPLPPGPDRDPGRERARRPVGDPGLRPTPAWSVAVTAFIENLSRTSEIRAVGSDGESGADSASRRTSEEAALRALNGLLIFRRTKTEPEIAAELPDKVDKLDHCSMTAEQIGLYQAVLDRLLDKGLDRTRQQRKGQVLAAITALKQICDHPAAYLGERRRGESLAGRSGKLTRLEEISTDVFAAGERILIFTHFARWGEKLAAYLTERMGVTDRLLPRRPGPRRARPAGGGVPGGRRARGPWSVDQGGRIRPQPDRRQPRGALRPLVEPRGRGPGPRPGMADRADQHGGVATAWCAPAPSTSGSRRSWPASGPVAGMVLPARSSLGDLDADQLRAALGLRDEELVEDEPVPVDAGRGGGCVSKRRRPAASRRLAEQRFWGTSYEPAESESRIRPTADPGALPRSLGPPPLALDPNGGAPPPDCGLRGGGAGGYRARRGQRPARRP